MWRVLILFALAVPAPAETVVATRTIRAQTVIGPGDVALAPGSRPGFLGSTALAVGMEARITLYAGRPIGADHVGPPALVERNQIVPLVYQDGTLSILTEGRALARAGAGETIRVMNLASRSTVNGMVRPDGTIVVGP
jgi:flagellar basal body P-ring formation protein FlgA